MVQVFLFETRKLLVWQQRPKRTQTKPTIFLWVSSSSNSDFAEVKI